MNLDELGAMPVEVWRRPKQVTLINSGITSLPGHVIRNRLQSNIIERYKSSVVIFGLDLKFKLKSDVLCNSRYSIVIENSTTGRFWTEKWTDAIMAGCIPIYYGSTLVKEVFPELSSLCFSKGEERQMIESIGDAVRDTLQYETLFQGVLVARERIIQQYTIVTLINSLLERSSNSGCVELNNVKSANRLFWRIKNRLLIFWTTWIFR